MVNDAFNLDLKCFRFIPDQFKTTAICDQVSLLNSVDLKYIPEAKLTQSVMENALTKYPQGVFDIPDNLRTKAMFSFAININPHIIRLANESNVINENA